MTDTRSTSNHVVANHLLEMESVTVHYPGHSRLSSVTALTGLSVRVMRGRLTVIQGRSGSGKTTALSVAAALQRPTAGRVAWRGVDPFDLAEASRGSLRRDMIGYVFQDAGLIGTLTAEENVLLATLTRQARSKDREAATRLLDRVGLGDRYRHFPSQLSGGEQQRIAVARALLPEPACLVLDEPTASLDRTTADDMISLLQSLATAGTGLLVASHDLHLIAIADEVVTLD